MGLTGEAAHDMNARRIYLLRHGETEENLRGIHQGQGVGGRLSARGRDDVAMVSSRLAATTAPPRAILTSPMARCLETAAIAHSHLPDADLRTAPRLAAKNSGHLAGRPRECAAQEAASAGVPIHRLRTPGGESSEDVQKRYVDLMTELLEQSTSPTVLVGHGGGIACLLLYLTSRGFEHYLDFVPGSAGLSLIEAQPEGAPSLRWFNRSPRQLLDVLPTTGAITP